MSNNEMTLKDKLKAYTRTPGSLIVMLLVMLSAILTFAVLIFLIVYVSCPRSAVSEAVDLFASLYIRECIPDAGAY